MAVVATAYRGKNKDETRIAKAIAQGFTGIKRMWVNFTQKNIKKHNSMQWK